MNWDAHLSTVKKKACFVISKLKFLSRFVCPALMNRVITSHFFGMLYYASTVWMNELTSASQWKMLNSLHYRALRTGVKDYYYNWTKNELNSFFCRATPLQWMKYSCSKLAINLYNDADGPPMSTVLRSKAYINDRNPGKAIFIDSSRLRIGRHCLANRLSFMKDIKFDWTQGIEDNSLRVNLKKTFINNNN